MPLYRVAFRVSADVAAVLDAQGDLPSFVSRAVTWYARFGEPCLEKLDALLARLEALERALSRPGADSSAGSGDTSGPRFDPEDFLAALG
ncbi:hypothetical protein [Desulfovirgula thermocuniculi]|uniref:hypothetical protein n=1 Tax=Desulfovirgula thermocuniculi TaxID=348842 RepID=UPI00040C40BF|nr:hypothetical protein [Desulfovirgula thermocuniculi]